MFTLSTSKANDAVDKANLDISHTSDNGRKSVLGFEGEG